MFLKNKSAILILVISIVLLLAGCTSQASTGPSQNSESRLDKIIKAKKIRIATYADSPGWSVLNEKGEYEGFDPDVSRKLAEALGVEIEFVTTDGVNRIPLLESDKVDVAISVFTPTNERAKSINFTNPYAAAGLVPMYSKNKPIKSWDDLSGKKVSVSKGSTGDIAVTKHFPEAEVVRFDATADAFLALKTGKVDVFVEEDGIILDLLKKNAEFESLPGQPFLSAYIAMGVKKGDQEWLNYLNHFIRNLNYSGETAELYKNRFGVEIPKLLTY
ncbi:transporter substrate-binding domain-containing protein [Cytobacillus depressus]|uniref:Transporter substrate-binding domain-containing protein n=1 Tax=Cytobacillus depressus TaxID=1602942 RepID=A0A6L3UZ68_9BACI|nr:transporter substrate-binding domain-containing protein [Cytobacillus depressus]KAB2329550.1 transporter substrate-binding domain-containing protein [Cytobacillus depressus]